MRVLVTGSAGFIGFHLADRLLRDGNEVIGLDAFTPYYDLSLKQSRHDILGHHAGFIEAIQTLEDADALAGLAAAHKPDVICHFAAQAGVRYSIENPRAYVDANLIGTFNVLEAARSHKIRHLMLASTSSVYGGAANGPCEESAPTDTPLSLYAATKKSTEVISHSYSHLWGIPTTVLRFFTVFGPWGRPDMAPFKFVDAMLHHRPIDVYNRGEMQRDFTFIDDLIEAIVRLIGCIPKAGAPVAGTKDSLSPVAPWRAVNIGRGRPILLNDFIEALERELGMKAKRNFLPVQPGDPLVTCSDSSLLEALTGYRPSTSLSAGVKAFCHWYRSYYEPRKSRLDDMGGDDAGAPAGITGVDDE